MAMSALIRPPHFIALEHDTLKLLKYLAGTRNLELGKVIHARLIVSDQSSEYNTLETNALIDLYSKCAALGSARQVFDKMTKRDVVSWSSLMAGLFQNGFSFEVLKSFNSMVSENDEFCQPNEYIFTLVLSSCSTLRYIQLGRQCHGYVLKSGLIFYEYVKNALVRLYSMMPDVVGAMEVLVSVPGYNTCTYNLILNGLIEHNYLHEASDIVKKMLTEQIMWDKSTYITIFTLCARLQDPYLGQQVHNKLLKSDIEFDVYVSTAIINMYGKCKEIQSARKVFDMFKTRNVVSWTSIINAYSQHGSFEESLELFVDMQNDDIAPNESTYVVLVNACAGLPSIGYGCSLHGLINKTGFKSHTNVGNALIYMYSRTGDIKSSEKIFASMITRNIITWNTMICGYSHHGLGQKSLTLFQEMLELGQDPNHVTFTGVLTACGHLGLVEQGFYYLNTLMKQKGVDPTLEHYTCIIGVLSKAGRLNEALNFMKSTKVKWDTVAWRTLLNACHVHGNYTLGTQVGNFITNLDPEDEGTYTLLSNIYAKGENFSGVTKVRELMKKRKIKKEPGLSWVEIKNQTHVFVSGDDKHPEFVDILDKLKDLFRQIKAIGYVADTGNVLHDVDDEQKEDNIRFHSEKLAVAYGLLKTCEEVPIRIMKNLRICDDCHCVMKLISKVTKRVIVVRDVNNFHHFEDGKCSCGDYW
ncbi:hypothetical protein LXL04_024107 [Taraxacum kok-saghyz]